MPLQTMAGDDTYGTVVGTDNSLLTFLKLFEQLKQRKDVRGDDIKEWEDFIKEQEAISDEVNSGERPPLPPFQFPAWPLESQANQTVVREVEEVPEAERILNRAPPPDIYVGAYRRGEERARDNASLSELEVKTDNLPNDRPSECHKH